MTLRCAGCGVRVQEVRLPWLLQGARAQDASPHAYGGHGVDRLREREYIQLSRVYNYISGSYNLYSCIRVKIK